MKGLTALNRQKRMPLIIILSSILLLILVIQVIRNIRIYIVYSSGILPFLIIGVIILAIGILYFRCR